MCYINPIIPYVIIKDGSQQTLGLVTKYENIF